MLGRARTPLDRSRILAARLRAEPPNRGTLPQINRSGPFSRSSYAKGQGAERDRPQETVIRILALGTAVADNNHTHYGSH